MARCLTSVIAVLFLGLFQAQSVIAVENSSWGAVKSQVSSLAEPSAKLVRTANAVAGTCEKCSDSFFDHHGLLVVGIHDATVGFVTLAVRFTMRYHGNVVVLTNIFPIEGRGHQSVGEIKGSIARIKLPKDVTAGYRLGFGVSASFRNSRGDYIEYRLPNGSTYREYSDSYLRPLE